MSTKIGYLSIITVNATVDCDAETYLTAVKEGKEMRIERRDVTAVFDEEKPLLSVVVNDGGVQTGWQKNKGWRQNVADALQNVMDADTEESKARDIADIADEFIRISADNIVKCYEFFLEEVCRNAPIVANIDAKHLDMFMMNDIKDYVRECEGENVAEIETPHKSVGYDIHKDDVLRIIEDVVAREGWGKVWEAISHLDFMAVQPDSINL